ncbi:MAG TPA: hypothetical protein VM869_08485 [Enhygromyxa sp.]|nr:hypothetical protein [Enhygromyxa sp.]
MPTESRRPNPLSQSLTRILREGPADELVEIHTVGQLRSLLRELRGALNRNPRLASLWLANPDKTLRAMGLVLRGDARKRFDELRKQDGWTDDDAAFERASAFDTPDSPELQLRFDDEGSLRRIASNDQPLERAVVAKVERLRDIPRGSSLLKPAAQQAQRNPAPPAGSSTAPTGVGSHDQPLYFNGTTGSWDVVLQVHENLLARLSHMFFAAQALGSAFGGAKNTPFVDNRFTLEAWLLKLIKVDLTFVATSGARLLTFVGAADDEVGICMRVSVVASSRWNSSSPWEVDDRYEAEVIRYGKLTKTSSVTIAEDTLERLFTANLADGRSVIEFDGQADAGREQLLSAALDAYFEAELPSYPVSFKIPNQPPFITWASASGFCRATPPDLNALSVCYGNHNGSFRTYILHHGRNVALGISDGAMIHTMRAELPDVPYKQDGITIESWDIALRDGHIEVEAKGYKKILFKVGFTYKAEVSLALRNGRLVGEVDESKLKLPAGLWLLVALFLRLKGIVVMAVAAAIAKGAVNAAIGDNLDLASGTADLFSSFENDLIRVVPDFDDVSVNPNGVFLRGNILINPDD